MSSLCSTVPTFNSSSRHIAAPASQDCVARSSYTPETHSFYASSFDLSTDSAHNAPDLVADLVDGTSRISTGMELSRLAGDRIAIVPLLVLYPAPCPRTYQANLAL